MFVSKSANNPVKKEYELVKKTVFCISKKIFLYGDFKFFYKISDLVAMKEFDEAKIIIEAKSVILTSINTNIICTCTNYNIPLIWYHQILSPGMWENYFNLILIGEFNFINLWREICKIA